MRNFLRSECELANVVEIEWKQGPYMAHTKISGSAITYWKNKGTLMLQGPTENTQQMNKRLVEHLREGVGGLPPTQTSTGRDASNTITEWEALVI